MYMKKALLVIKLCCITFFSMAQKYSSKPTSDCITYIESFGIDVGNIDSVSTIPGEVGIVYRLPTKEVVLVPSDFRPDYPGFIFQNIGELNKMIKSGFFPIENKFLTFWELERGNLNTLPHSIKYFKEFLEKELNLKQVNLEISQLEEIFQKIVEIKQRKIAAFLKEKIIVSYCLLVMQYMVENFKYEWLLEQRYEVYNSYSYPLIKLNGETKDVIELLYICLDAEPSSFKMFRDFIGLE